MANTRDSDHSSDRGETEHSGDPPPNSGGNLLSCSLLVVLMIGIALVTAIGIVESGKPLVYAITAGAINGVLLTCMAAMTVGSLIRWYWGRTRGYPFKHGDVVRVIRGTLSGSEGHIVSFAQGEFSFEVELHDDAPKGQRVWLSAHALRRPGHRFKL